MPYTGIIGTGSYLPEKILTNHDVAKIVDTSHDWIVERTGIHQRHIAADDETTTSMAHQAALKAVESAEISVQDIDLIVVATCTPDQFFPSCACLLQDRLGIQKSVVAFDVAAACSGFVYALHTAHQFIKAGSVRTALVVASDVMSRSVDWTDRSTCVLFADGAGAVVIQAKDEPGIMHSQLYAKGQLNKILYFPNDLAAPALQGATPYLQMKGRDVYKFSLDAALASTQDCANAIAPDPLDVDWLIPHQANVRMLKPMAKKIDIPFERVMLTLDRHGNTSSASIPIALDFGMQQGMICAGQNIMLLGFGGGMTWGNIYLKL